MRREAGHPGVCTMKWQFTGFSRHRRGWMLASGIVTLVLLAIFGAMGRGSLGASDTGSGSPIPCFITGTPVARADSPILNGCAPVEVGTPTVAGGLTVTLKLSSDQAAPQDVTVEIRDENGQPVDDATVTIINRHLEMDMGDYTHQ